MPQRFSVNQRQDYWVASLEAGTPFYGRYLYARSYDSQTSARQDSVGQDYLTFLVEEDRAQFVLCDGVSGSFCGYLAAKLLGDMLLDFLVHTDQRHLERVGPSIIKEWVENQLRTSWRAEANKVVDAYPIPPDLPDLQRAALTQLQNQYGSETVFVAGRLLLDDPQGDPKKGTLLLMWMGDITIHLYDSAGQPIPAPAYARWTHRDRWSTKRGIPPGAELFVWCERLEAIDLDRLLIFSDGLATQAATVAALDDHELQEQVGTLVLSPHSDDISLLDLRLKGAPASRIVPYLEGNTHIAWQGTGATLYEMELSHHALFEAPSRHHSTDSRLPLAELPASPTMAYRFYRVRALTPEPEPWSQPLALAPLRPPPPRWAEPATHCEARLDLTHYRYRFVWEPVTGAQYYQLRQEVNVLTGERDSSASRPAPVYSLGAQGLSTTDVTRYTGAAPTCTLVVDLSTPAVFYLEACGPSGRSAPSSKLSLSPPDPAAFPLLVAPTLTLPPSVPPQVASLLRWTVVPFAARYRLERSPHDTFDPATLVYEGDELQCAPLLSPGERHFYRVQAVVGEAGSEGYERGPWSNLIELVGPSTEAPASGRTNPHLHSRSAGDSAPAATLSAPPPLPALSPPLFGDIPSHVEVEEPFTIRWRQSLYPEVRYQLEQADDELWATANGYHKIWEGSDSSYTTQVKQPGKYFYRLRVISQGVTSEPGPAIPVKAQPLIPQICIAPAEVPTQIQWTRVPDADGYELERQVNNRGVQGSAQIYSCDSSTLSRPLIKPSTPGTHHYRVRAKVAGQWQQWSAPVSFEVPPLPSAPRLQIEPPQPTSSYTLRWTEVPEAIRYILTEWGKDQLGKDIPVPSGTTHMSCSHPPGACYFYEVTAQVELPFYGRLPLKSNQVRVDLVRPQASGRPLEFIAGPDGILVKLKWDHAASARYRLYWVRDGAHISTQEVAEASSELPLHEVGTYFVEVRLLLEADKEQSLRHIRFRIAKQDGRYTGQLIHDSLEAPPP